MMTLLLQVKLKLRYVLVFLIILNVEQVKVLFELGQLHSQVVCIVEQVRVVLANDSEPFIVLLSLFLFFFGFLLFALVSAHTIVVSNLESLKFSHFLSIDFVNSLCQVMEESEHLTQVVTVHHSRVIVHLLIRKEQI